MIAATVADDQGAKGLRAKIAVDAYNAMLAAAPTPPQPIYDEAKERELFKDVYFRCDLSADWLSGVFKDKQTRDMWDGWRECAQSPAKAGEVVAEKLSGFYL